MANKTQTKKATRFLLPAIDQGIGLLFLQANTLWRRNVELALYPHGITYIQFVLLNALTQLTRNGDPISQNELAAFTMRDVNITSQVLRLLEKRNLVTRVVAQNDARTRQLAITTTGLSILEKAIHIVKASDDAFFAMLGTKQQEFIACLQALIKTDKAEQ